MPDVPKNKAFYLGDKSILNLKDLLNEIRDMPVEKYRHYASSNHNYFSDWIRDILKHRKLAKELRETKTKYEAIDVLEKHLNPVHEPKEEKPKELKQFVIAQPKEEKKEEEEVEEEVEEIIRKAEDSEEKEEPKEEEIVVGKSAKSTEEMLKNIAKDEREIKNFLWKHFAWDMAKEFMYGMAIGILIGFVLSKLFFTG